MSDSLRVLFFTMANLNIIDGSSVWMHSVAESLHVDERVRLTVALRAPEQRDVITRGLRALDRVDTVDPRRFGRSDPAPLDVADELDLVAQIDAPRAHDIVLLRAYAVCLEAVRRRLFRGRLWAAYILEPERDTSDPEYLAGMGEIARAARHVICQSEEMRALLESLVPAAIGKTIILAPGIPTDAGPRPDPARIVPRMIYAGKFHRFYPVDRLISISQSLRAEHHELEFHVAGDKFHRPPDDMGYADRLRRDLSNTPGVVWHGGIGRDEVAAHLARGGVALSVWDFAHGPDMNNLVISTKLLDFCSLGLPVILNRTAAQEAVLGADYPLFVDGIDEVEALLRRLLVDPPLYRSASERTFAASRAFTYPSIHRAIAPYLDRLADELRRPRAERRSVAVQGDEDGEIRRVIGPLARYALRPPGSGPAPDDVVISVDGRGDAAREPSGQRSTRILRFSTDRAAAVIGDGWDRIVPRDAGLATVVAGRAEPPPEGVTVIPAPIDDAQLARPKLPGAVFRVAVAGVPTSDQLKALEQFADALISRDERFRIVVRWAGSGTDEVSDRPAPKATRAPIAWEPDDEDRCNWLRTTGFVVAANPIGEQIIALAEAMASGAVPVLMDGVGGGRLLLDEDRAKTPAEAAAWVVELVHAGATGDVAVRAARRAAEVAGVAAVRAAWDAILA